MDQVGYTTQFDKLGLTAMDKQTSPLSKLLFFVGHMNYENETSMNIMGSLTKCWNLDTSSQWKSLSYLSISFNSSAFYDGVDSGRY